MDRVRNEEVHRRAGIERELARRADQRVSTWFGHVEQMDEYHIVAAVVQKKLTTGQFGQPMDKKEPTGCHLSSEK